MSSPKHADILKELADFHTKLEAFSVYRRRMIEGKHLGEKEIEALHELYNDIGLKVGQFQALIAELTGGRKPGRRTKDDKWATALSTAEDPSVVVALGECVQATADAIVKLKDDINAGKRDAGTGKLV